MNSLHTERDFHGVTSSSGQISKTRDQCAGFEYSLLCHANIVLKLHPKYLAIKIMQGYLCTSYLTLSCSWPLVSICVLWTAAKETSFLTTQTLTVHLLQKWTLCGRRIFVGAHKAGGQLTVNLPELLSCPEWIDAICSLLLTSRPFTTKLSIWKSTWSYLFVLHMLPLHRHRKYLHW